MRTSIVTPPAAMAVDIDEVKDHLRILHADEDAYIRSCIFSAQEKAETFTSRKLITQTWKVYFDVWPDDGRILLPFGQLQSVTHVKYTDVDGDQSTFSSDDYIVDTVSDPGRIALGYGKSWPSDSLYLSNPIEIQFVCGYGSHSPKAITNASNASSPIVITIDGHGYTSGEVVYVKDVGGNTSANGIWQITVLNENTFSLTGSAGAAAYTSGGTAIKHEVPERILQAIKTQVSDMYENREPTVIGAGLTTVKLRTVEAALWPYRLWMI